MKKMGLTGYVYDLSADYNYIDTGGIKNIQNYLTKKNGIASIHYG